MYGATPAVAFGPKSLKALRAAMLLPQPIIDAKLKKTQASAAGKPVMRPGWSRTYANRQTVWLKLV